jgi:hypothetical protein
MVVFPLANDIVEEKGVWVSVGENTKCRIDDLVRWTSVIKGDCVQLMVFAAGTDLQHESGPTLATLSEQYYRDTYEQSQFMCIVNSDDKAVYGTDQEIVWGVKKVLSLYPPEEHDFFFLFGSQKRHVRRIEKNVQWRFPKLVYGVMTTRQTKEIPLWREFFSYCKLLLGDTAVAQWLQIKRRRFSDNFDNL